MALGKVSARQSRPLQRQSSQTPRLMPWQSCPSGVQATLLQCSSVPACRESYRRGGGGHGRPLHVVWTRGEGGAFSFSAPARAPGRSPTSPGLVGVTIFSAPCAGRGQHSTGRAREGAGRGAAVHHLPLSILPQSVSVSTVDDCAGMIRCSYCDQQAPVLIDHH